MTDLLNSLLTYGIEKNIIVDLNRSKQNLINLFNIEDFKYEIVKSDIFKTLDACLDIAYHQKLFGPNTQYERDAFEALIFDQIMPTPKETKAIFQDLFEIDRSKAILYLYELSKSVNYIKTRRISKNINWIYHSTFGNLQMTINLSKPEKDPKDIAKAQSEKKISKNDEPLCVLCKENEHRYENARMNLRIIPIHLNHELWHFQYSPYAYFNEHAIILSDEHKDMHISKKTFYNLFDFVDLFPGYFIGSNADLPIVGGSILNHDHYQAGRHHFPIEKAYVIKTYKDIDELVIMHMNWPLSTIRMTSSNKDILVNFSNLILDNWKNYSEPSLDILAYTDRSHQTITPILRKENNQYTFDLILRNNRTTKRYPDGIFHPHKELHHIKKENIGLIEAMGLAVLPGRLKHELNHAYDYIKNKIIHPDIQKHLDWLNDLENKNIVISIDDLYAQVGKKFEQVLIDAGVFKLDEKGLIGMDLFIQSCITSYKKNSI